MKTNYCKNCGLLVHVPAGLMCFHHRFLIKNPDEFYCANFSTQQPDTCDICGQIIIKTQKIFDENHTICPNCFEKLNTCVTCTDFNSKCDFDTNPIDIPQMITKEVRRGPMISMGSIVNPERVEKTCKVNCHCYDDENGCLRKAARFVCDKYKTAYKQ